MGDMAIYLAFAIEEGRLDYKVVMTNAKLVKFKADVDLILITDGYGNLIVPLT